LLHGGTSARILVSGGSGFIGTHLIERLRDLGHVVLNLDIAPPNLEDHFPCWVQGSILDIESVRRIFRDFEPEIIFHLAAKANLKGSSPSDFPENIQGTEHIVKCANETPSVQQLVHFSTQYVVRPGVFPKSDDFYLPYTPYGESKAIGERVVKNFCSKFYLILRPTNVWGPWHSHLPYGLWRYICKGLYFHPGFEPAKKYYAYVSNAVDQVVSLVESPYCESGSRVWYLSDPPIDNLTWFDAFSVALRGVKVIRLPRALWSTIAKVGDVARKCGFEFPVHSERYFRLTVNENIPLDRTLEITGLPKVTLQEGVKRSVEWYLKVFLGPKSKRQFL
jgi:nucleoside-diphosphate-sugar epimerase